MSIPNKLVTNATRVHNKYGVGADCWRYLYGATEAAGNVLTNLVTYCPWFNWPDWGNGVLTSPTWVDDASANAPYVQLLFGDLALATLHGPVGATEVYPQGTMLIRFKNFDISAGGYLLSAGAATDNGRLFVNYVSATDELRVQIRNDAGTAIILPFVGYGGNDWHTLVIRWNGPAIDAFLDTFANKQSTAIGYSLGWRIVLGQSFRLSAAGAGGPSGYFGHSIFGIADRPFTDREIQSLLMDPYGPLRPPPGDDLEFAQHVAVVGRPTATGASFCMTTGQGVAGNLSSNAVGFRVRVAATQGTVWAAAPTAASVTLITDVLKSLNVAWAAGAAGTRYWYMVERTPDGANWYPLPTPPGHFTTQRAAGTGRVRVRTDSHEGQDVMWPIDPAGYRPAVEGFGLYSINADPGVAKPSRIKAWESWLSNRDAFERTNPPDFNIHLGDWLYCDVPTAGDGDITPAVFSQAATVLNINYLGLLSGAWFCAHGNHSGTGGLHQDRGGKATQKQATICQKRMIPNPTNTTYPEGGENEGAPTILNQLDWLPPLDGTYDAAWRTAHVIDAGGENASPLRNYYAFTWANCLFVVLDPQRYGQFGGTNNSALGPAQRAWLETTLLTSTARWKVICWHSAPRGADAVVPPYRRWGRGRYIGRYSPEERWLEWLFRRARITLVLNGHDHTFSCHLHNTINYVSGTSVGYLFDTSSDMVDGFREHGATDAVGAEENRRRGIICRYHVPGDIELVWDANTFTVSFRQTGIIPTLGGANGNVIRDAPDEDGGAAGPHWVGESVAVVANTVTLSEIPQDVGFVITETDLAVLGVSWWTHANLTAAPPGGHNVRDPAPPGYAMAEQHSSTVIPVLAGTVGPVRVAWYPRTVWSRSLLNATPGPDDTAVVGLDTPSPVSL